MRKNDMKLLKQNLHSVTAFAPATCANVAVGFDILGFAMDAIGDTVTLTRRNDTKLTVDKIDSNDSIPLDPDKNVATIVIARMCRDLNLKIGFSTQIKKGIPLSSGLGGSAASTVAALVACNAFLEKPLSNQNLLHYALLGEEAMSGHRHADNVAPCLYGGFTLVHAVEDIQIIQLPIPDLLCVIVHPHLQVATRQARKILKEEMPLKNYVTQSANLAATISALYQRDDTLLQKSLVDVLIEPQRTHFVPGFHKLKNAALQAGALAVSFSGSGPSLFALTKSQDKAQAVGVAIRDTLYDENVISDFWISPIGSKGAYIISELENLKV
jgi:homoserine kinase